MKKRVKRCKGASSRVLGSFREGRYIDTTVFISDLQVPLIPSSVFYPFPSGRAASPTFSVPLSSTATSERRCGRASSQAVPTPWLWPSRRLCPSGRPVGVWATTLLSFGPSGRPYGVRVVTLLSRESFRRPLGVLAVASLSRESSRRPLGVLVVVSLSRESSRRPLGVLAVISLSCESSRRALGVLAAVSLSCESSRRPLGVLAAILGRGYGRIPSSPVLVLTLSYNYPKYIILLLIK